MEPSGAAGLVNYSAVDISPSCLGGAGLDCSTANLRLTQRALAQRGLGGLLTPKLANLAWSVDTRA